MLLELAQRLFRPAAEPAQLVVTRVNYYLREPCFEGGSVGSVISAQRKIHFGKTVLNDLFDLFALRKEATGDARYLTAVTFEQLLEGCLVTGAGRGDQRVICRFFKWVHNVERVNGPKQLPVRIKFFP